MKQHILLHIRDTSLEKTVRSLLAAMPLAEPEQSFECTWLESIDDAADHRADCLIVDGLKPGWVPAEDSVTSHKPPVIFLAEADQLSAELHSDPRIESVLPTAYLNTALLEKSLFSSIRTAALQQQIMHLKDYDALTGLATQNLLQAQLGLTLGDAARNKTMLALMAIRIDKLDELGDQGERGGKSAILRAVAQRLVTTLRKKDLVARSEDDVFMVIIKDVRDDRDIARSAYDLLTSMKRPFNIGEEELALTVSIGVALFPDSGLDTSALMAAARAALGTTADPGNEFRIFDTEVASNSKRHFEIEQALPEALTKKEFEVLYQPQFELKNGQVVGAEALLRWYHPSLGDVPPEVFIPIAEESDTIMNIGEWTLRESFAEAEKWHSLDCPPIKLAVNVSGRQFRNQKVLADVETLLEKSGLPSEYLELEITERVFIQNIKSHQEIFNQLKDLGVRIALDDFGIGYSSLSYLRYFAVDALKIDRSFIAALPDSKDDATIVRAIIALSHSLNIRVIAEGIENEAQLEFLHEQGCDEAQGHLYSKPLHAHQLTQLLDTPEFAGQSGN